MINTITEIILSILAILGTILSIIGGLSSKKAKATVSKTQSTLDKFQTAVEKIAPAIRKAEAFKNDKIAGKYINKKEIAMHTILDESLKEIASIEDTLGFVVDDIVLLTKEIHIE